MKAFALFLIATLLSCQKQETAGPEQTKTAFIYDNQLYVDGCEENVRLDNADTTGASTRYKPTAATLPILRKALETIPLKPNTYERAVIVQFMETGRQVELLCGWGAKPKVGEIEILSIHPR
ncbi:hypothetical protein [Spirosoma daeguense]